MSNLISKYRDEMITCYYFTKIV